MTIRWPETVLRPQSVAFDIAPRTLAGPTSVSGLAQIVASDAGIWKAKFGAVMLRNTTHVLMWRAIDNLLEGRLGTILVPLCRGYQPAPAGSDALYDSVPHSDDTYFDDDSGYTGGVIDVTLSADAAVRATSASINIGYADTLQPGQHFSIGERLYRLRAVIYTAPTTADITFRPPLREAATTGTSLNFDDPVCRMRLVDDSQMALDLAHRRFADVSVNFIEAL